MTPAEALGVLAAGIGAGTINTIVGSGTLLTFPVLLAVGIPPVTANVSNTLGLVSGSVTGAIGYRRELTGQRRRLIRLGAVALVGGVCGAVLLVTLPSKAFEAIVPVLIAIALVLIVLQRRLARAVQARRERDGSTAPVHGGPVLALGMLLASTYGGYFGAAQGILYLSLMGLLIDDTLQRLNALKNVLAAIVNGTAAVFFVITADMNWAAVGLIAGGSTLGGLIGARVGRRLPPTAMRALIITVGIVAIVQILLR